MKKTQLLFLIILTVLIISCKSIEVPKAETKETSTQPSEIKETPMENKKMEVENKENTKETSKIEDKKSKDLTEEEQKVYDSLYEECDYEEEQIGNYIFALKNKDENHCNKIDDEETKKLCIAEIKKDPTICRKAENYKLCEAMVTKTSKLCEEEDYYCFGIATNNPDYCEKIENEEEASDCFLFTELNTEEFSTEVIKQKCSDIAYAFMSSEEFKDEKFCKFIKNEDIKEHCYEYFMK